MASVSLIQYQKQALKASKVILNLLYANLEITFFVSLIKLIVLCLQKGITIILKMARKRTKGTKYSRITKQQKFAFLTLCLVQKLSINQAAHRSGIHYSTAKTILFFHKNQYKSYATYCINNPEPREDLNGPQRAKYMPISIDVDQIITCYPRIEVISKCFSNVSPKIHSPKSKSNVELTREVKVEHSGQPKMEDLSSENKIWYQQQEPNMQQAQRSIQFKKQITQLCLFQRVHYQLGAEGGKQ